MKLFVLGASGKVGKTFVSMALNNGHQVTGQSRQAGNIADMKGVEPAIGHPIDATFLIKALSGHDAVIMLLGVDTTARTTLFSDATRAVISAMEANNIRRLVAVTGVGSGETRGHGGWFYNRIILTFFTRHRYNDKDKQERLIATSDLDWTIVRPAPFCAKVPDKPLTILTSVAPDDQLNRITIEETAQFLLQEIEQPRYIGQRPFIGHRA